MQQALGHDDSDWLDLEQGRTYEPLVAVADRASRSRWVVSRSTLFRQLDERVDRGVTVLSAPAGSGKTVLLRSWVDERGLSDRVAWVSVERDQQDAQAFWISVVSQLRSVARADTFIDDLAPTPDFHGESVVERLLSDLRSAPRPTILVIDDLHELKSVEALRQLELLLTRRPPALQVVIATRQDPRLRLHRLRLAGDLTELRNSDLRFTLDETTELLVRSGVRLSEDGLQRLQALTEGWAAGVRLAALLLAGSPDPEQVVSDFSGTERTVAEYLMAEVLDRQPADARRLLLRTSVVDRVNGELADVLVGAAGSERVLQELEEENAFVVSLDPRRSWFRFHHLFADLLRLELRRTDPDSVRMLHRAAAEWYAANGYPIEAIRQAQAAEDWAGAARMLMDHGVSLWLDGHEATIHALLAVFPSSAARDPELAVMLASDQLTYGSLDDCEAYIALAERGIPGLDAQRAVCANATLALIRLSLARRRGDFESVLEQVQWLLVALDEPAPNMIGVSTDLRAMALMHLGIVERWSLRLQDAERHLTEAAELARRIGRPWVEIGCLAHLTPVTAHQRQSFAIGRKRCEQAIRLAEAHGWALEPIVGVALTRLGGYDVWQGRFDDAERWLDRAERAIRPDLEPATGVLLYLTRGELHAARGEDAEAIGALRTAEQLQSLLVLPHPFIAEVRQYLAQAQLRQGDATAARTTLAGVPDEYLEWGETRSALASLYLAEEAPQLAAEALAPVLDGSVPMLFDVFSIIQPLLLDAIAQTRLGQHDAAAKDVERALAVAEMDGLVLPFVTLPIEDLLKRHRARGTRHSRLLDHILGLFSSHTSARAETALPAEPGRFTDAELRVLRLLPTNLTVAEIGHELSVSENTAKTHIRQIYAKLGVHRRTEAVDRARALRLLSSR